jgi:cyclase
MLSRRIIPCLDVKDGVVVKGVKFREHVVLGGILDLAQRYRDHGADELVFYDITASADQRSVDSRWIEDIAKVLDIPFCVAGGIRSISDARRILNCGADKVSINSPALERPELIGELAEAFGSQCVVVGIDSLEDEDGRLQVFKYTGKESKTKSASIDTISWAKHAVTLGAGEIVLNCMNQDGVGLGYDIKQLRSLRQAIDIPIIASGGAGNMQHFADVFLQTGVDGALAAGVFHRQDIHIQDLKQFLKTKGIQVR